MKLLDVLLSKAKTQELAHFYIVEGSPSETFVHEFIRRYYQEVEGQKNSLAHLMDHPDVFVLLQDEEKKESAFYTVAEAEKLARFLEFRPVQSRRKFVVIPSAQKINPIIANKWLKLLEEPQGETTIFLLNPRGLKLLDTLHSRALHLRLPEVRTPPSPDEWNAFVKDVKGLGLAGFLEKYPRGEASLSYWVEELIHWESGQGNDPKAKEALAKYLKTLQEMDIFHQPTATKWTFFYTHLKEHVLPRYL